MNIIGGRIKRTKLHSNKINDRDDEEGRSKNYLASHNSHFSFHFRKKIDRGRSHCCSR